MELRSLVLTAATVGGALGARLSTPQPPAPGDEQARADRVGHGLRPRVLVEGEAGWSLRDRMEHYRVPGVSIAVFRDFHPAWARGYGVREAGGHDPVTPNTLFQAASIGKPVAAAVALGLVEAGMIPLDADVNTVLRSWKIPPSAFTREAPVTLRLLLSHNAGVTVHGFPGYAAGEAVPTLRQALMGLPPANTEAIVVDREPGKGFRYSGGGYLIVQQVLEDATGRPFARLGRERLLAPLGMNESEWALVPKAREVAAGHRPDGTVVPGRFHRYPEQGAGAGLWTTPSDLARFALGVQQARRGGGTAGAISKATAELMTTKATDQTGLGFFLAQPGRFEHGGVNEGYVGRLVADLEGGYGAVVLTNSDNGGPLIDEVLRAIALEYGWERWLSEAPVRTVDVDSGTLDRYTGRYRVAPDMIVDVARSGADRLRGVPSFGEPFDLLPIAPDTFVRRDNPTRYRFDPEASFLERRSAVGQVWGRDPRVPAATRVALEDVARGDVPAAVEAYRRLRAEAPADDPTGSELDLADWGVQFLGRLDFARATALLEVASALYPSSVRIWFGLGEASLWSGQVEKAETAYRRAVASRGSDRVTPPDVQQLLASVAASRLREIAGRRR